MGISAVCNILATYHERKCPQRTRLVSRKQLWAFHNTVLQIEKIEKSEFVYQTGAQAIPK